MPTQHSRKLFLNYSGMSRPGSITEGPQPQPILTPLSLAPKPQTPNREQRDPRGGTWTQQDTSPARTLINSFMRQRVNPMETCQLSFLLGQASLMAGTLTTLAKLFLWELGVSDLGVGSDLLLRLHLCASVYMWLPFF